MTEIGSTEPPSNGNDAPDHRMLRLSYMPSNNTNGIMSKGKFKMRQWQH